MASTLVTSSVRGLAGWVRTFATRCVHYIASQRNAQVNGYHPRMPKTAVIGPFRVDEQMRADLERIAVEEGDDATLADVVRMALRDFIARRPPRPLPPA